jgi:CubicO group peptidase (beta-lactamase class C family)
MLSGPGFWFKLPIGRMADLIIMRQVDHLMKQAVGDGVFPGGVLLVLKDRSVLFFEAYGRADIFNELPMTRDTIFDLASLTKPLATTLAVMNLIERNKLGLEQTLESVLPQFENTDRGQIRIKQLLAHISGLPDYRPYYKEIDRLLPGTRKSTLRHLLAKEELVRPTGRCTLYSDIGFMILEWVVEKVSGRRLDHFVGEDIYRPLGIETLFFVDLDSEPPQGQFAATELCPWRNILLSGVVHDENAWVARGIEGHSGLFGNAQALSVLLSELLSAFHGRPSCPAFQPELVRRFLKRPYDSDRALGFDTPSLAGSSSGRYFSRRSVGHLGFTGTSFWVDLDRFIIVILLTNRIHPSRANIQIKAFRPKLHDVIMKNILSAG